VHGVGKNANISRKASFIIVARKRAKPFMLCVLNSAVPATEVYTSNDTWTRSRTLNIQRLTKRYAFCLVRYRDCIRPDITKKNRNNAHSGVNQPEKRNMCFSSTSLESHRNTTPLHGTYTKPIYRAVWCLYKTAQTDFHIYWVKPTSGNVYITCGYFMRHTQSKCARRSAINVTVLEQKVDTHTHTHTHHSTYSLETWNFSYTVNNLLSTVVFGSLQRKLFHG